MRRLGGMALMAIVVALAPMPELTAPWQRKVRERSRRRYITARVVGDAYARRWGHSVIDDRPAPPTTTDPYDRGRAFLRRGEISLAIPELRKAARSGDPVALTDLAAALLGEADLLPWSHPRERASPRLNPSARYASALEAIALLHRALEKRPGLAAAHFNLALALERVGLTVEVRRHLEEAIRMSDDVEWNEEAREHAGSLPLSDPWLDRDRVQAYVEVTGLPSARSLLQPYLQAQEQRLRRARLPAYPDSRFRLAADTYTQDVHSVGSSLTQAMQTFCSGATTPSCAMRYYTAGALYAAGRKSEAAVWLHSVEDEIQRAHGGAGLRALRRWEEGLNMAVRRNKRGALEVFEAQFAEHRASEERALAGAFDELGQTLRALLTSEALSSRDTETAFRYADDSSLRYVQSALASDAAILRYATTKYGHKVVFVVRRGSVDVVTLHDTMNRVEGDKVLFSLRGDSVVPTPLVHPHGARGTADIAGTAERMRIALDPATGARLHELLIAPVLEKLHGVSTIAVVRNAGLAEIPFGALFDVDRGQYLAERFTIVHAPSARAAVELSKRTRDFRDSTLLAIGATEFDRTQGEVLPGVDREIAEITARSLCARVLSGEQATPDAIQRALTENAVIHYGGHIVRRGADVRLLLASSRGRDSLSAEEIAALRLDKARVVVLAGCRGAASGDPRSFVGTVADAFLIAGVPTVIATSYELEDAEAPPTMRLLHTFLRNGDDPAEALRKTTLEELRTGRGVPLSLRFQAIGGTGSLVQSGRT